MTRGMSLPEMIPPSRDFLEQASRNFTPRMDDVIPASSYNPEGSIKSEGILGDSHSVRQQRAVAFEGLANEQREAARRHSTLCQRGREEEIIKGFWMCWSLSLFFWVFKI